MSKLLIVRLLVVGLMVIIFNPMLVGQHSESAKEQHGPDHLMLVPEKLIWKDGPASLPNGSKVAVLEGDPANPGPFTLRLQFPANYKVPPHWHPAIEHVTVLSGTFYMGLGESFDESNATRLPVGGFAVMAIGTRHFAFTKQEGATLQLHGIGPWGITYVNPADDPRNKTSGR